MATKRIEQKSLLPTDKLAYSTFFYWTKKFELQEDSSSPGFTKIEIPEKGFKALPSSAVELEIEYPSGAILRLYKRADASWIKSLL